MDAVTFKFILIIVLLFFSAFISGSESAFFSLTHLHIHKMKEDHMPFVSFIQKLLARPRRLLATIIIGNESVNIAIAALATSLFLFFLGPLGKWVAIVITTVVLMILCEAIPKTFAVTYPRRFASAAVLPLTGISKIIFPAAWLLEKISDAFVRLAGEGHILSNHTVMEAEFKTLVDAGHKEGALEASEKDLIHSVFELADTKVADIMTPRVDMFCISISTDPDEIKQEVIEHRYSRIPFYGSDKDDIIGILNSRDLLAEIREGKEISMQKLLNKPYFVPEEQRAHSMLADFKLRNIQMAIVVDEYGGISGLVTLTDILSSLFGNIYRELDLSREKKFTQISEQIFSVSGMLEIDDFNDRLGGTIPTEDFDTIGGFVLHLFGQLPAPGDSVYFENFIFTAEKISKTRISALKVVKRKKGNQE
ncbi:MAG: hemolysin family protein [Syntrophales bacterium]|nr:hemolysin family protein [Syntrophales bacterium]MDY0044799.1 hemolysin family protein [Syntrophales bacterium]